MTWRVGLLCAVFTSPALHAQAVEFNRDIRPVLSDRCFACHGPDAARRMAGLRLDVDGGAKAVAAKLLRRIATDGAGERMPPPYSGKPKLTAREVGADPELDRTGSAVAAVLVVRPAAASEAAVEAKGRNPIDGFILARLAQEGLTPAPEADKRLLIRRVSLDLTGLPPTPAEVDAFVADRSPKAYEKVVDRLLASPRYGERMAFRGWKRRATATATATRPTARATCGAGATG